MPLIGINPTRQREARPDTLTRIAQGLDIAKNVLGITLAVPEFLQKRDLQNKQIRVAEQEIPIKEATAAREKATTVAQIGSKYRPTQEGEAPDITVPSEYGGSLKLRNEGKDLSDLDKATMSAYSADYIPVPQKTDRAISVKIGGNDTYWEPKPITGADPFSKETKLRQEFLDQSKTFPVQYSAYQRIKVAGKDPSAAGDMALLYGYMKLLDPGSTVREGEYATAAAAGSVPDRIVGLYNKVLNGEKLADQIRKDFLDRAKRLYQSELETHQAREKRYINLAHDLDMNPGNVVIKLYDEGGKTETPAGPKPGEKKIINGKEYEWVP